MSAYLTRLQTLAAKIESSRGVDAGPTMADAIRIEEPRAAPELQNQETNEAGGGLDTRAPGPTGGWRNATGRIYLRGSGTAGTEPDFTPLLQACTLGFDNLATDVTGTAQAGGASAITLAAGASAVNDAYKGMVLETTGGTGAGQKRIVTGYVGATKVTTVSPSWASVPGGVVPDATTTYAVRKGTRFRAQSVSLPSATIYRYRHRGDGGQSRLEKIRGWAGNARMQLGRQGNFFELDGRGSLAEPVDVSHPGPPTYRTAGSSPPWINAQVYLGNAKAQCNNFGLDLGITVAMLEDPNARYGYDNAATTARKIGGRMQLPMALLSERNPFTSWEQGVEYLFTSIHGSVAGNRVAIMCPQLVFTGVEDVDVEGFGFDGLPFRVNGDDTGLYLYFW